jgi:hypothetical protein
LEFYGNEKIIQIAKTLRDLDLKTVSFLSLKGKVKMEDFICYTTKASTPKHWNF